MLRDVVALVDGEVHAFELGVVCEVFGMDRSADGLPCFDFAVCSATDAPIPAAGGITMRTSHRLDRAATADLVVVPAWHVLEECPPQAILDTLRHAVDRGALVMGVCVGAFALAAAGLLDGRRATSHWRHAQLLADRYPNVHVECDKLYIQDGPVITSAGTAAGIDACLYLVRQEYGADVANGIARRMVVPPHRDGGQAQYIDTPVPRGKSADDDLGTTLLWAQRNLHQDITVAGMASRAHMSARTFARRFTASTGTTPHQWLTAQRVFLAQRLLETHDMDIDEVARRAGFGGADLLRHHFARQVGVSPTTYRQRFRHLEDAVTTS